MFRKRPNPGGHGNDYVNGGSETDKYHGSQGQNTFENREDIKPKIYEDD
ncbi:MAG: hypothetical protein QXW37_01145 [Candidatus Nitrosotenuis sp.]